MHKPLSIEKSITFKLKTESSNALKGGLESMTYSLPMYLNSNFIRHIARVLDCRAFFDTLRKQQLDMKEITFAVIDYDSVDGKLIRLCQY